MLGEKANTAWELASRHPLSLTPEKGPSSHPSTSHFPRLCARGSHMLRNPCFQMCVILGNLALLSLCSRDPRRLSFPLICSFLLACFFNLCLVATAMALWLYEGDKEVEHELPWRLIRCCVHLGVCSVQNMLLCQCKPEPHCPQADCTIITSAQA